MANTKYFAYSIDIHRSVLVRATKTTFALRIASTHNTIKRSRAYVKIFHFHTVQVNRKVPELIFQWHKRIIHKPYAK